LDLFCGAGGAAMGYHRAGFDEIVGVDIKPQPRYPFRFVQGDALEYLACFWLLFDAVHASPPCQRWLSFTKAPWMSAASRNRERPDHLAPVTVMLEAIGLPFVIENVPTSPLKQTVTLCGSSFGLRVRRHRKFASNFWITPRHCAHCQQGAPIGVYGHGGPKNPGGRGRRYKNRAEASAAMGGLDWMSLGEMVEAIPPVYTEYIGRQLIDAIKAVPLEIGA
jgi:DNA (cytosine-5)-methyltransferase 1